MYNLACGLEPLNIEHASKLYRYLDVPYAGIAILTNGEALFRLIACMQSLS